MTASDLQKKPTLDFYSYLQSAFDFFNDRLFDNELPPVVFTITRKKNVCGFFRKDNWVTEDGTTIHEISFNPAYFITASPLEFFQTMCHEQTHLYISHIGKDSRASYHNQAWADKMIEIGLMPVGKNGAVTGQKVSDRPIPGGRFEKACVEFFSAGYRLAMVDRQYHNNISLKALNDLLSSGEIDLYYQNNQLDDDDGEPGDDTDAQHPAAQASLPALDAFNEDVIVDAMAHQHAIDTIKLLSNESSSEPLSDSRIDIMMGLSPAHVVNIIGDDDVRSDTVNFEALDDDDQVAAAPSLTPTKTNELINRYTKRKGNYIITGSVIFDNIAMFNENPMVDDEDYCFEDWLEEHKDYKAQIIYEPADPAKISTDTVTFIDRYGSETTLPAMTFLKKSMSYYYEINQPEVETKPALKTCYQCPICEYKVWGRPKLALGCLTCGDELIVVSNG